MSSPEQPPRRQYVNFTFYKIDPAWRRLPEVSAHGKQEFLRAVEEYQARSSSSPTRRSGSEAIAT